MIPTITNDFYNFLLLESVSYNLVAILINKPTLGLTDLPTADELKLRKELTVTSAVSQEISSVGYKRFILEVEESDVEIDSNSTTFSVELESSFVAPSTNSLGPFTHICYIRGANLIGANNANGNNRGDTTGVIYKVEPINNAPLTLQAGATFTHVTDITFTGS